MNLKAQVDRPGYVLAFAGVVSLLFTGAIMTLHALTAPIARRNARRYEQEALVELFGLEAEAAKVGVDRLVRRRIAGYRGPDADARDPRRAPISIRDPRSGRDIPLLVAYRSDLPPDRPPDIRDTASVLAYAFPVDGVGFWARIDGYLAVTPELDRIVGVVFLRHSETPGLGGRLTEKAWRDRFRGLDVTPPAEPGAFLHVGGERPAAPRSPAYGRHVDAITGATGTSTAVGAFLNERLAEFHRAAKAAGLGARRVFVLGAPAKRARPGGQDG